MALKDNVVLAASEAFGKISALWGQARSYSTNPTMLSARATASRLANGAWTGTWAAAKSRPAMIGGAAGGAIGAGYDYATDRNSDWRSSLAAGIRGAGYGSLAGMGYYGYKAAGGMSGIKSMGRAGMAKGRAGMSAGAAKVGNWWGNTVKNAGFNAANEASPYGLAMDARFETMRGM